jgi:hypothetical protein
MERARRVFKVKPSKMIIALAAGLCGATAALAQVSEPNEHRPARQDGRLIERLQWVSPHGELPGTYRDYLQAHPPQPVRFAPLGWLRPQAGAVLPGQSQSSAISILVDETLYPSIATNLAAYETDLTLDGYTVYTETVSGGTPENIKAWVQGRYAAGSDGVLFIGDITATWAEVSGSVFPSDLFYMDLDGYWADANLDGIYDVHQAGSGDEGPELYVARLYAHTLNYDTEANMVNGYLNKAHTYRIGALTQPWRGLEYVDEDWHTMDVVLDLVYGDDVERFDYGYFTTGVDYLEQMDVGRHFVQVCAHSYSGGHHFGTRPTDSAAYAYTYVYSPSTQSVRLLLGSDDGIKAWLNGQIISGHDVYQGWMPDQFVENVTLDAGWNRLLCKISQGGGDYSFSARFTDLQGADVADLRYQLNDPDTHGDEPDYIRGWLLNGFHQDISDSFWNYLTTNYLGVTESGINPTAGQSMGGKTWTAYSSDGGYVDLDAYAAGADYGCTYAFARIYADTTKSCRLRLGYDDGARVWLNGQGIVTDNRYGGYEHDMTSVDVTLNAGANRLLVKISEWMGEHGFSARFSQADGSRVQGLTYDPAPDAISFISTWLMNGPYINPDDLTRLSEDYLAGEDLVRPSEGDAAPFSTWQRGTGTGQPFDIALFYDHGDWVYSQTIQDRDPPVLFYNLFSCGPGRFTDDNYLAGAYIFNTTYGLITVASAKSGSMLNFQDFTTPLA